MPAAEEFDTLVELIQRSPTFPSMVGAI